MKIVLIEYKYYPDEKNGPNFYTQQLSDLIHQRILVTNQKTDYTCSKTIVLNHTNQGKDIGAKLTGIDFLIKTKEDLDVLIMTHDKKSLHSPLGNYWSMELKKIISDAYLAQFVKTMEKPGVGICCASKYIRSEYNRSSGQFNSTNNEILKELLHRYKLQPPSPFSFVAGTIFGCKWAPVRDFFLNNPPLQIRKILEKGNVQDNYKGSYTHSWERVFSWIITSGGYSLEGL